MAIDFPKERPTELQRRLSISLVVVTAFFLLVFLRLFYLQVWRGRAYATFSAGQTIKEIRLPATRGVLFDRNLLPIVESRPSFDLVMIPQHLEDREKVKRSLASVAGIDPELVESRLREAQNLPSFYPTLIAPDIPYNQAVRVRAAKSIEWVEPSGGEEDPINLRGIEITERPLRSYPQGAIAASTIGYLREISAKELEKLQREQPGKYLMGDLIGTSGLERYWERKLRGTNGYERKTVNAAGLEITGDELESFFSRVEPVAGENLVLTLDSRLQRFAEERFRGKSGALVALDPRTGEVLAIVSTPSYDPAALVSRLSHQTWADLVADPRNPLLNRAIQGTYPPGSTFKLVTAVAGLEEGLIRPDDKIDCRGGLQFGKRFFRCWKKGGHGSISIHRAISESCDTFFYRLGLKLGVDRIAKYARLLGLGERSGIDLEGEKGGTIPTSEWKKKFFKEAWQEGETLSIAVGQGYDTVTPLQNTLMVAQIATGRKIRPHFVKEVDHPISLPLSEATLSIVRSAMNDTVASPSGTAHGSASRLVTIAGKTGTAQVMSEEASRLVARGTETGDHAWFVAYAPVDDPRIAVGVVVEHGGFGASAAAPIAKDLIEKFVELTGPIASE